MAERLNQRLAKQQEVRFLEIRNFQGLSLKLDPRNRPKESFQQLDNFDLYIPGSIRKILPPVLYSAFYTASLLNCAEYLAQANNPQGGVRRVIGVSNVGDLQDISKVDIYAPAQYLLSVPTSIPIMLQFPGYFIPYNMRSWRKTTAYLLHDAVIEYGPDGNTYIFEATNPGTSGSNEPIWPTNSSVIDGGSIPSFSEILGGTTADGGVTWTCLGAPAWIASHLFSANDPIIDSNGNLQFVKTVTGNTRTIEPTWAAAYGALTPEYLGGGILRVMWECLLQPRWRANNPYILGTLILDGSGNIQKVTTPGTSGAGSTLTWTNRGQPTSTRFFAYYLAIITPGVQPVRVVEWQYDPTDTGETPSVTVGQMGVSPAKLPPQLEGMVTTPNLNGYYPQAGRAYVWTYYNPQTLQESSPSPFVGKTQIIEVDNSNAQVTINGSVLTPLPPTSKATTFSSYQSFYIATSVDSLAPPIGTGYNCIRVYATKDGGSVFFLVNTLFDNDGVQISNSDGSIPIALLKELSVANSWTDYFPLPTPQNAQPSVRVYEGGGPVNFAPDPENLGAEAWQAGAVNPGPIYVTNNTAPDGSNSFQIDEPNAGKSLYRSATIDVNPGQDYYLQMYLDKSSGTGGTMAVRICSATGVVLLSLAQADSTAGTVTGTFNTGAHGQIFIQIFVNGVTIAANESLLWSNPILQLGTVFDDSQTHYPTTDDSLVIPAPLPFSNDPPPIARSAKLFLDAMWFVDDENPSRVWYTQQSQYEKVGASNYIQTSTDRGTAIMQMIRVLDRLILMKERTMEQISTYPPSTPQALDPQHGGLAYRCGIPFGAALFALMTHGLGALTLAQAITEAQAINSSFETILVGDDIKPIIDSIAPDTLYAQNLGINLPSPAVLNSLNLFLIGYTDQANDQGCKSILGRYMGTSAGFFRITDPLFSVNPNPNVRISTIAEIQVPAGGTGLWPLAGNGAASIIALADDTNSYVLFAGTQDGSVTATAMTQPLPTLNDVTPELWDTQKVFRSLYVEGVDIDNFQVSFSVDGGGSFPWGPYPLTQRFNMAVPGKQLTVKLTHAAATSSTPEISMLRLDWDVGGLEQGRE